MRKSDKYRNEVERLASQIERGELDIRGALFQMAGYTQAMAERPASNELCWNCGEPIEYQKRGDVCRHCGKEIIPF